MPAKPRPMPTRSRARKTKGVQPRAKAAPPRPRASRLDPGVRQDLILDKAAGLVIAGGVSACSLDAVALAANVSKPLVYKYFPNRGALFAALLNREFEYLRGHLGATPGGVRPKGDERPLPIDELLKTTVHSHLAYLVERGSLFRALTNEAGAADEPHGALLTGRNAIMRFWTERMEQEYGLPADLARIGVIMATHALEGAQGSVRSGKIEFDRVADFWTTFVRAGWKAVAKKYAED